MENKPPNLKCSYCHHEGIARLTQVGTRHIKASCRKCGRSGGLVKRRPNAGFVETPQLKFKL